MATTANTFVTVVASVSSDCCDGYRSTGSLISSTSCSALSASLNRQYEGYVDPDVVKVNHLNSSCNFASCSAAGKANYIHSEKEHV